ncbi:hypothetical protein, partial [Streptomyces sp. NPDC048845]|uniref:hypothetical protein n=1 Tax=Streptomyces sp. NPDC048845 TaxID=3155390 RepID=UPI0034400C14
MAEILDEREHEHEHERADEHVRGTGPRAEIGVIGSLRAVRCGDQPVVAVEVRHVQRPARDIGDGPP